MTYYEDLLVRDFVTRFQKVYNDIGQKYGYGRNGAISIRKFDVHCDNDKRIPIIQAAFKPGQADKKAELIEKMLESNFVMDSERVNSSGNWPAVLLFVPVELQALMPKMRISR